MLFLLLLACKQKPAETPVDCTVAVGVSNDTLTIDGGDCASAALDGHLLVDGDLTLSWQALDDQVVQPIISAGATGGTFYRLDASGPWTVSGSEPARWWRQGYQSWSWSGVTEVTEPSNLVDDLPDVGGDGDSISVVEETPWSSWWAGLLGRSDGGVLLAGAVSARRTRVWLASSPADLWVVWGGRGEAIDIPPYTTVTLDPVWFGAGADASDTWEDWADATMEFNTARDLSTLPPVGWSDWYSYYGTASEADIRANLAVAAASGLALVQVDDGWERAWGDWTANERYPSGMRALAGEIQAEGLIPGLWMAPFYVDRSTTTYQAHPDWWVRGADGEPIGSASCDCAVIDVTHPDAAAWMKAQVADRVAEGSTYLKLDFLYAGALEGTRQEDITGMDAYARGLEMLREAAGDAWILACGAPFLPSVGWVESYRSGADIAFVQSPDPDPAFLRWQARSSAARAFANGRWWWNDADNLLIRPPFDDTQVRGALAAQVASGGAWALGDDLPSLAADRLALATDPAIWAHSGQRVRVVDPLDYPGGVDGSPVFEQAMPDDTSPVRWELGDGTVVLLNLGDTALDVEGPGGTEQLTGESASAGTRTLAPGAGEVWVP